LDYNDTLKNQKEYNKEFYYNPDGLWLQNRKDITRNQILGLIGEIAEFQEAIKVLPWKAEQNEIEYDHVKEELIDIYHFFMNLCILWGIETEAELKKIYYKKNELNYKRGKIHEKPTEGFKCT